MLGAAACSILRQEPAPYLRGLERSCTSRTGRLDEVGGEVDEGVAGEQGAIGSERGDMRREVIQVEDVREPGQHELGQLVGGSSRAIGHHP